MIKDYKSFLKMQYISRKEDLDGENLKSGASRGLTLDTAN